MLAVTALGLAATPIILAVSAVADLGRGRRRLPTVRVALFSLQYAINDTVEIVLAPVLWLIAGWAPGSTARARSVATSDCKRGRSR